jgi:hypothetical protein
VREPLRQAFPFPSTLGEVTLHPHSQACVFIYSLCGKWVFPPLLCSFPPTAAFTSFPAPDCWACAATSAFSVYLQLPEGFPLPPLQRSGCPASLLCVFFVVVVYSVSLFSLGGGQSVQGAMLIWPRVVCGSTAYCLAYLVYVFPSHLDAGNWWWCENPPGFSI